MRLDSWVHQDDEESHDEKKDVKVGAPTITLLALILYQPEKSKPIDYRKYQRVAAARSIGQSLAISAFSPSESLIF